MRHPIVFCMSRSLHGVDSNGAKEIQVGTGKTAEQRVQTECLDTVHTYCLREIYRFCGLGIVCGEGLLL